MTERKRWPDHVEALRLDAVALLLDIRFLQLELEQANRAGDRVGVARINKSIEAKRDKAITALNEARRA